MYDKTDEVELSKLLSKNVNRKENTNFINNGSQKVVIVVSIFLPLTRGTASVKWRGGGGGRGQGFFNKFSTSERWI